MGGSVFDTFRGEDVAIVGYEKEGHDKGELGLKNHVVYIIEAKWGEGSPWVVRKRYSDFEDLHKRLLMYYGKLQVPHLTGKRKLPVGGMGSGFVEKRARKLQGYLRAVINNSYMWFTKTSERLSGPGTLLGINEFVFQFLEFQKHAIVPKPTKAIEGEGVVVVGRKSCGTTTRRPAVLPLLSGVELDGMVHLLEGVEIADDDTKIDILRKAFAERRQQGKPTCLNSIQAQTLLSRGYFGEVRVRMCELLVPLVQDLENSSRILQALDFDEDIEAVSKLIDGAMKEREGESDPLQPPPDSPTSLSSSAGRSRGVTVAPE